MTWHEMGSLGDNPPGRLGHVAGDAEEVSLVAADRPAEFVLRCPPYFVHLLRDAPGDALGG